MFCLACLMIKVLLCWKWSKTQEGLYARTVTFSVLKPVCVNKTALASLPTFGPYRTHCQKRQRLLNNSVSCYTRAEYYLCTGHQAWWLWSHVHECPLQPGSCVPGSPGRSHWWRTLWPCPALSPTMPDVRPLSCRARDDRQLLPAKCGETMAVEFSWLAAVTLTHTDGCTQNFPEGCPCPR